MGRKIGFSHLLSLGNEADVTETDVINYLSDDGNTTVIAAYIEGIREGQRFIQIARKACRKKPLLVLKAGMSEEGARAVSSHTGSLAGSVSAYQTAFKQSGAIVVDTTRELINCAMALDWQKCSKGNKVVIVTNAGGPAALASDEFAKYGIQLADISSETGNNVQKKLNPAAQVRNPIDMLGGADENAYKHSLSVCIEDESIDMVLVILVPQALVDPLRVAESIVEISNSSDKPFVVCMMGDSSVGDAYDFLHENQIPVVQYPKDAGVMLHALYKYGKQISQKKSTKEKKERIPIIGNIPPLVSNHADTKIWGEYRTREILRYCQIPTINTVFAYDDPEDLKTKAKTIGYPIVLKAVSDDIYHKSDMKAVILDIDNDENLIEAYQTMKHNINTRKPNTKIDGFMVQKMAGAGQDLIVGVKRDVTFGPVVMFGLGGIFVELFKDIAFRIAPLQYDDCVEMIQETKAKVLLNGFRGSEAYDIDSVIDVILRISALSIQYPKIQEFEINPLRVYTNNKGTSALDCRMIIA